MSRTLSFLLLVVACGYRDPDPMLRDTPTTEVRGKWAVRTVEYVSRWSWQQSPWYRHEQDAATELPILLAIASDETACFVPDQTWALLTRARYLVCPVAWRTAR